MQPRWMGRRLFCLLFPYIVALVLLNYHKAISSYIHTFEYPVETSETDIDLPADRSVLRIGNGTRRPSLPWNASLRRENDTLREASSNRSRDSHVPPESVKLSHQQETTNESKSANVTSDDPPCSSLQKPRPRPMPDAFQPLPGFGHVFSAHYDHRDHNIKVIAIGDAFRRLWCQMWRDSSDVVQVVSAYIYTLPENHGAKVHVISISCALGDNTDVPYAVSISDGECTHQSNLLFLARNKRPAKRQFTVCVTPLFFSYDNVHQLVELIEVNQLFGAEHFVFYNLSIGPNMDKYLRYYAHTGTADVIQWALPRSQSTSHGYVDVYYFAQIATYMDCLLRNLLSTTYITFLDMDEVLVPRSVDSWGQLIEKYKSALGKACSIGFLNTFFRIEWPASGRYAQDEVVLKYQLQTLLKVRREGRLWGPGARSKYIAKTEELLSPSIHTPSRCTSRVKMAAIDQNDALLHHYRSWDNPSVTGSVTDAVMYRHRDKIVERASKAHTSVRTLSVKR